jgi:hypothetical protein
MALSRTQVINRALQLIAVPTISDPDEDSESARSAKLEYDAIVRSELASYPWYFAKAQAQLAQDADAPLFKFARSFTLPTDFLRLVELENRWVFTIDRQQVNVNPLPPYEMQGRSILTDFAAPLRIGYLRDVSEDTTIWHPLFEDVVVAALAMALANPLAKSTTQVELMAKMKRMKINEARRVNAIQRAPDYMPDGSWMVSRIYG